MKSVPKLLLLLSFGLMELHNLFEGYDKKVLLFLSPSVGKESAQTIGWYVYDTGQMLSWVLVLLAILFANDKYGIKKIIAIHLGYRIFDIIMYWWDFRQNRTAYIVAYSIISLIILFEIKNLKWVWKHLKKT